MPDVYATIANADEQTQEALADVIEGRAADPRHRAMLRSYLAEIQFPAGARVLEIGCGTGAVTRELATWPGVLEAVGVDPSPVFVERARALSRDVPNVAYSQGDGRALELDDESFDVVVMHTTLSHVPEPERLLAEVVRVLRPAGWAAVFDGDFAAATVATSMVDPLEECVRAFREGFVNDPWLVRSLPRLLKNAGLDVMPMRSHGYVEAPEAGYMRTWVERGADALVRAGRIGEGMSAALKAEAARRSDARQWFGHITFASILGRKPSR